MIAHDTGHRYIDEVEHGYGTNAEKWRKLITQSNNVVVQSPGVAMKACIDNPPPGIFLVLMRRSVPDIHASSERIRLQGNIGIDVANRLQGGILTTMFGTRDSTVEAYRYWDEQPKSVPYLEIDFASLANHLLWTPAEDRADFRLNQTSPNDLRRIRGTFREPQ